MVQNELYLGLDIGGTKIQALLTDADGRVLEEARVPTATVGGADLVDQIVDLACDLSMRHGADRPFAMGLGLPAAVDPQRQSLSVIPNIQAMEGEGFFHLLQARFGARVVMDNDANLAALGEYLTAPADPLAFVAIGTGIGMGIVAGGRVLHGAGGAAGEISLLPLGGDLSDLVQRGSGPVEMRLGGEGWRAAYLAATGREVDLAAAFADPDPAFIQLIAEQADLLARTCLAVSAVLAPQTFVLGGSIGNQPRLAQALEAALPRYFAQLPQVRRTALGPLAGARGAAYLARETFKE